MTRVNPNPHRPTPLSSSIHSAGHRSSPPIGHSPKSILSPHPQAPSSEKLAEPLAPETAAKASYRELLHEYRIFTQDHSFAEYSYSGPILQMWASLILSAKTNPSWKCLAVDWVRAIGLTTRFSLQALAAYGVRWYKGITQYNSIAAFPARWTEQLLYMSKGSSWQSAYCSTLAYAVNLTVLPIFLAVDATFHSLKSLTHASFSLLTTQESKNVQLEKAKISAWLAYGSVLGVLGTPFTLLSADLVSRHFLPKLTSRHLTNYGSLYRKGTKVETPSTRQDIQKIVQEAKTQRKSIAIAGSHMSQGGQNIPSQNYHLLVDMKNFNYVKDIDVENMTATVGAGSTWKDLQAAINPHGLAVQVMQASNIFSIGGSLSANCHGWDHTMGSMSNTIETITLVNAQGEIETIDRDHELFKYVVGGYGNFGVILEVKIKLTKNVLLEEWGEKVSIYKYVEYFKTKILADDKIKMHLYRLTLDPRAPLCSGFAHNYSLKDGQEEVVKTDLVDEAPKAPWYERFALHYARRRPNFRVIYWAFEQARVLAKLMNPKRSISTRNEIMRAPIMAATDKANMGADWLQEFFVDGDKLPQFLEFLGDQLKKHQVPVLNASVRYVKKDEDAALGYATKGDRFAIVLFFDQSLHPNEVKKAQKWVRAVIDHLIETGGTYYLPYQHFATREQFQDSYPAYKEVLEAKKRLDPNGVFKNAFASEYLPTD